MSRPIPETPSPLPSRSFFPRPPAAPARLLSISALALALAASCATAPPVNHYRNTLSAEQSCCNRLGDPAAQRTCLADIPQPQGDEVSALNQETFACVHRFFRCDLATGRATRESAQQQLDCLNDLESTQQARNETGP